MITADQQSQAEQERREQECPKCRAQPVGANEVWVKEGQGADLRYRRELRCDPCYATAFNGTVSDAIKASRDSWQHQSDYYMSGRDLRHIGASGDRLVHSFNPGEKIK